MASSPTEICNSALIKIGAELITDLTNNTKRAILCNEQYKKIRKKLLSSHPWNFSTKRAKLTQLSSTPDYEFDYEYAIPSDCLRIFRVKDDGSFMYRIEAGKLLTSQTEVYIEYAKDEEDVSLFTEYFTEYLAYSLAYDLCYAIVQSNAYRQSLKEDVLEAKREAKNSDGQEGTPRPFDISTWTDARIEGHTDLLRGGRHY
jgi:hypothetical protein